MLFGYCFLEFCLLLFIVCFGLLFISAFLCWFCCIWCRFVACGIWILNLSDSLIVLLISFVLLLRGVWFAAVGFWLVTVYLVACSGVCFICVCLIVVFVRFVLVIADFAWLFGCFCWLFLVGWCLVCCLEFCIVWLSCACCLLVGVTMLVYVGLLYWFAMFACCFRWLV